MIIGSCLCGGVTYEAEGPLTAVARCHCTQCRKASGAEFATNGAVRSSTFRVTRGEDLVKSFEWSPGNRRCFCGHCGSPLFKRNAAKPDEVRLRLGNLDSEISEGPKLHVFVSEKPAWSEITDELPRFETLPKK